MNNFEAQKQKLIVRQSQMERAIQYSTLMGIKPTPQDLLMISDVFTDFIFDGKTKEVMDRARKMDKYLGEQYFGKREGDFENEK
jgi:hypothetical protein